MTKLAFSYFFNKNIIHSFIHCIITHANESCGVKRSSPSVCVSVCPHDKTKTAKTTITELATGIVHHESTYPFKGQKVKGQGHRFKKHISGNRVASMSFHNNIQFDAQNIYTTYSSCCGRSRHGTTPWAAVVSWPSTTRTLDRRSNTTPTGRCRTPVDK